MARGRRATGTDTVKQSEVVKCDTVIKENHKHLLLFATNPVENDLAYHGASRGRAMVNLWRPQVNEGMTLGVILGIVMGAALIVLAIVLVLVLTLQKGGKDNRHAPRAGPLCIVFTDIEQSTHLWSINENAMVALIEQHNKVIRSIIKRDKAYEVALRL